MNWIYLLLSSLIEVFWVITLKHSYGFTHLVPSIISILSMALSTYLLSLATRSIPIGVCYAIWTGVGAIGASILGVYLFDEPVNLFEVICFILVTFGIIGLKLFDTAKQTVDKWNKRSHWDERSRYSILSCKLESRLFSI